MGQVFSELDYAGYINDYGQIFDARGNYFATITDSGYIVSSFDSHGKIDEDGTIRDASGRAVGRIQADGYVFIHSRRVGRLESSFVERITPKAWNAGVLSSYSGRPQPSAVDSHPSNESGAGSFWAWLAIILVGGIILGIIAMVNGWGGIEMLFACPVVVALFFLFAKIFGKYKYKYKYKEHSCNS